MNKILKENIESVLKLTNNNELRITNKHIYEVNDENKIINSLNVNELKRGLDCAYSFNNEKAEGVFWIKDQIIRANNIETDKFLKFVNLYKNFGKQK